MGQAACDDPPCKSLSDEQEQPSSDVRLGIPCDKWSRSELDARADWENGRICRRKNDAANYWFLGKVLLLIRRGLNRGQWQSWRQAHKIDRSRAQRSQLFALAFASAEELEGLSINKAVRLASRQLGRSVLASDAETRVRRRLLQLKRKTLPSMQHELNSLHDSSRLLPLIADVIESFDQIERAVRSVACDSLRPVSESSA
ncbi:MAG TPA: hypothetical protein VHC19_07550 [Pirellulales bacterium]|nr:hypothetical protein [Pirellulales bacterium]